VNFIHKLADGPEMVSNTIHLRRNRTEPGGFTDWPANTQEIANKARDKYLADNRPFFRLANVTTFIKAQAYHLSAAGLTLHKAEAFTPQGLAGQAAQGGGTALPFDVACVVSLRTDTPGDFLSDPDTGPSPAKRSRGRVFTGVIPSTAMAPNGRFSTVFCNLLADEWVNLLQDLDGMTVGGSATPDSMQVGVLSKAGSNFRRITSIVVDDLPDTQQRRSNKQLPNRFVRPIDQGA